MRAIYKTGEVRRSEPTGGRTAGFPDLVLATFHSRRVRIFVFLDDILPASSGRARLSIRIDERPHLVCHYGGHTVQHGAKRIGRFHRHLTYQPVILRPDRRTRPLGRMPLSMFSRFKLDLCKTTCCVRHTTPGHLNVSGMLYRRLSLWFSKVDIPSTSPALPWSRPTAHYRTSSDLTHRSPSRCSVAPRRA